MLRLRSLVLCVGVGSKTPRGGALYQVASEVEEEGRCGTQRSSMNTIFNKSINRAKMPWPKG